MIKKLILTNRGALERKYKQAGWDAIRKAIARLATADVLRGITTVLDFVDAPSKKGVPKVTTAKNDKQAKATIDALYRKHGSPDYLLILGAPDVVPFQKLENPLAGADDPDRALPSDLPYACEASFSRKVTDFVGPTRVVGRLPNVNGSKDPKELVALIDAASGFGATPGKKTFVISAAEWKGATRANVKRAFGAKQAVELCPPNGPGWKPARIRAPLHFINCHGAGTDPNYYGDSPDFPQAHLPANLVGIVTDGTIVVAECCYGGEIYDPPAGIAVGIANTYLSQGAVAYCGSTNTAYGDATAATRCAADILCTDFMAAVLKKASTGRALLQARQAFVKSEGADVLDPVDLKTLGQFLLLGDPSLRPFGAGLAPKKAMGLSKSIVEAAAPGGLKKRGGGGAKSKSVARALAPSTHKARRAQLKKEGASLSRTTATAQKSTGSAPATVRDSLAKLMAKEGLTPGRSMRYQVVGPTGSPVPGPKAKSAGAKLRTRGGKAMVRGAKSSAAANGAGGEAIHVMFSRESQGTVRPRPAPKGGKAVRGMVAAVRDSMRAARARTKPEIPNIRGVVARTRDGKVLSYKPVWSK
jgi:hypothetical protein